MASDKGKISTADIINKRRYMWSFNPATRPHKNKKKYDRKRDKKKVKGNYTPDNFM